MIEYHKLNPSQKLIDIFIVEVSNLLVRWNWQEAIKGRNTNNINKEYQVDGNERNHTIML